jgi:hypothetical protein
MKGITQMTKSTIDMAREAGFNLNFRITGSNEALDRLVEYVRADEREQALAAPVQEPVAYLCENAVGHKYFRWKKPSSTYKPIALYTTPPAAPVPDAITDNSESLEYIQGWNDCRAETLKMRKP